MLTQKFPRICKSREIPILNNDSSLFIVADQWRDIRIMPSFRS